jgi:Flp pilus assembly protein CpaB
VDVLVTIRQKDESRARVAASDVQVLTAGTRYEENAQRAGRPIPTTVVTLLVTSDDAKRIAAAQREGPLLLSLRGPGPPEIPVPTHAFFADPPAAPLKPGVKRRVPMAIVVPGSWSQIS